MARGKTHMAGDFLGGIVRRWERQAGGPIERIILSWPEVVGETIARSTRPLQTEGKTLIVEVRDAIWRDQLTRFYKVQICRKLNQKLDGKLIRDIRFRVGSDMSHWENP